MGTHLTVLLSAGLFVAMLVCLRVGFGVGRRVRGGGEEANDGSPAIEAAIFALLGLLLGFAFAGSMSRLDDRRSLIVREANAISTAYFRIDLLPPLDQPAMRHLFREYLEARVQAYEHPEISDRDLHRAAQLQRRIWHGAASGFRGADGHAVALVLLPAINEMFDVTTARTAALRVRLPVPILFILIVLALLSALIAGHSMGRRNRPVVLHSFLYAAAVATTVYVVLDLDNPRSGLIRLQATERVLQELHDSIRD